MKVYDFELKFSLPEENIDAERLVETLFEAGCDDALIGTGQMGRIGLLFSREAESALAAVTSAIKDVQKAIPNAILVEAAPDLVGLTDIAEILGCSRQNVRKLFLTHQRKLPAPVHEGQASLWHLSTVLRSARELQIYPMAEDLQEVAEANWQVNLARQLQEAGTNAQETLHLLTI